MGFLERAVRGFWRKKKPEKDNGAQKDDGPQMGKPDYESLRIVRGFYIERDIDAAIEVLNKSGVLKWFGKPSNRPEQASDKPQRSSEDPE